MKMKHYKIAFCGLGSIGQRHLKNIVKYLTDNNCTFQIDAIRSGKCIEININLEGYITEYYTYYDKIPDDYDIIFITNPTSMHIDSILKYQKNTKSMFIEKPITNNSNVDLNKISDDVNFYVACPLRYMSVLQYLKKNVACNQAYGIRAICSTYLPNWHPNRDYTKSYSANKDMGGGVAIDLIHEWDYLIWLFGKPDDVKCIQRKISNLKINSEDVAIYIGSSKSKVYELHLDYFGKEEVRNMEIYMPNEIIRVDIRNGNIYFSNNGEKILFDESRDDYQLREIEHFFDIIEGRCINDNGIEQAMDTMLIAKGEVG